MSLQYWCLSRNPFENIWDHPRAAEHPDGGTEPPLLDTTWVQATCKDAHQNVWLWSFGGGISWRTQICVKDSGALNPSHRSSVASQTKAWSRWIKWEFQIRVQELHFEMPGTISCILQYYLTNAMTKSQPCCCFFGGWGGGLCSRITYNRHLLISRATGLPTCWSISHNNSI